MATLTPLTVGNASTPSGWVSAPNGNLGDNSDATYGYVDTNADGLYDQGWLLAAALDADFGTMLTLNVVLRYGWSAAPSSTVWEDATAAAATLGLECRIVNGATILAAADAGGTFKTVVNNPVVISPVNSGSVGFDYVNTASNKATWDAARVEIRIRRNRLKGGSSEQQRVYEADFTGTYTAAASFDPATIAGQLSAPPQPIPLTTGVSDY